MQRVCATCINAVLKVVGGDAQRLQCLACHLGLMGSFLAGAEICQGPVLLGGPHVLCKVLPCGHPDLRLVLHP